MPYLANDLGWSDLNNSHAWSSVSQRRNSVPYGICCVVRQTCVKSNEHRWFIYRSTYIYKLLAQKSPIIQRKIDAAVYWCVCLSQFFFILYFLRNDKIKSNSLWCIRICACKEATGFPLHDLFAYHDDVIKWKHFPCNWPFVRGTHRSPVNSPHKGQWRGALMFSLICVWTVREITKSSSTFSASNISSNIVWLLQLYDTI